jgi:hypothetical protein
MLNSGMGTMHNHQGTLGLFLPPNVKEEKVIQRFHGVNRHKKFSTISVVNREGQEIQFLSACRTGLPAMVLGGQDKQIS